MRVVEISRKNRTNGRGQVSYNGRTRQPIRVVKIRSPPSVSQTLKWAGLVVKRPIQRCRGGRADEKIRRKPMNEK